MPAEAAAGKNGAAPGEGADGVVGDGVGFARTLRVLSAPGAGNAAQWGRGTFGSIQAALDSIPKGQKGRTLILIGPGIFREKLLVERRAVCLRGTGFASTIITFDDCAKKLLPSGEPMNTFNSYTVYIGAPDFEAEDLCIENSAGAGRVAGQAIACYVDADRVSFRRCRIRGRQDTLFCGPLPANPAPRGLNLIHPMKIVDTAGNAEHNVSLGDAHGARLVLMPSGSTRHYFRDCLIEGDVDFIFGSATVLFERCEIRSLVGGDGAAGWITAASTPPGQSQGFVFLDCTLTLGQADGLTEERVEAYPRAHGAAPPRPGRTDRACRVYLGRPWRPGAKVVFLRCQMGAHIAKEGWDAWDAEHFGSGPVYAEYASSGPGAPRQGIRRENRKRTPWALSAAGPIPGGYSPAEILAGDDGWAPFITQNSL